MTDQPRAIALDQPAEQRRDARGDLGLGPGAVGKAGAVGGVDDRRVGQQRAGRRQHRQPADAGIEEQDGGGGVHGGVMALRCIAAARHALRASRDLVAGANRSATSSRHEQHDAPGRLACRYLLGSIPFGLLLTRAVGQGRHPRHRVGQYRRDQRAAHRAKGLAAATLLLDAAKGALAVWLAQRFWPGFELHAAAGALIGHLYPVWLRFRAARAWRPCSASWSPLLPIAALVYAVVWIGLLLVAAHFVGRGMAAAASAPVTAAVVGDATLLPAAARASRCSSSGSTATISAGCSPATEPRVGRAQGVSDADLLDRLRLIRTPGIGPITFRQLLLRFGSAQRGAGRHPRPRAARRRAARRPASRVAAAEREIAAVEALGARYLSIGQGLYPRALAELENAPPLLTVKGRLDLLERPWWRSSARATPARRRAASRAGWRMTWAARGSRSSRAWRAGSTARRMTGRSTAARSR